ncbi:MAG: ABC transporter substrate-binding protein [Thermosynechococcus sp.]
MAGKCHWFLLALGAIALSGCTATESPSVNNNSLPLGVALAQTGNAALYGQEALQGVQVAGEFFNQTGQIKGQTLRLVIQDTGSDEAGAVNVFQTLINRDRVIGIVGPTLSQQAFSADPIAEQAGVPVVAPSNTARGIPQIGAFISRVSAGVDVVAPTAIQAALEINPNIRRVAVFFAQDDAFSRSETEIFQKAIQDNPKLELVSVQQTQTTDTNFQAQINATLNLKPDLIVISGLAADGGNLIRQLRELGYQGLILGGNGVNTVNLFPVCRRLCDGVLVAQAYNPENRDPMNVKFRNAFETRYRQAPSQFSAQAFTAVQVFADSLARLSQKKDLSQLPLEELRQVLNQEILKGVYETPLGEIRFTPEGEVLQRFFYIGQIEMSEDGQSGKFSLVKKVERPQD